MTAFIFPAFVLKYKGKEIEILKTHNVDFLKLLKSAEEVLNVCLADFDINSKNYINDELKNQYLSYVFGCAFSDILKSKSEYEPKYISGFSMGLYAALYHVNSISFETGLLLIRDVFYEVKNVLSSGKYLMASVIGFEKSELELFCKSYKSIEIVIQNGNFSFVITGKENEIKNATVFFLKEGAVHVSIFNVNFSYHSKILAEKKMNFVKVVKKYKFSEPDIPLISMINQKILNNVEQIRKEISLNVVNKLNFLETVYSLINLGADNLIEVGAGTSLLKSSKFIEGNFTFESVSKGKII